MGDMSKQQQCQDSDEIEFAMLRITAIHEGTMLQRLETFRRLVVTVGGVVDEVTARPASKGFWQLIISVRVPPQGQTGIADLAKRAFTGAVDVCQTGAATELRQVDGERGKG